MDPRFSMFVCIVALSAIFLILFAILLYYKARANKSVQAPIFQVTYANRPTSPILTTWERHASFYEMNRTDGKSPLDRFDLRYPSCDEENMAMITSSVYYEERGQSKTTSQFIYQYGHITPVSDRRFDSFSQIHCWRASSSGHSYELHQYSPSSSNGSLRSPLPTGLPSYVRYPSPPHGYQSPRADYSMEYDVDEFLV